MGISLFLQIAGMFLIPFLIVIIPILLGRRYGIYRVKKFPDIQIAPVSSLVGTAFVLLAFMLAFTFQIASDRLNKRKGLLLEEVTNIRTSYLQAGLIPEPFRSQTRKLMVEYVDLRVNLNRNLSNLDISKSRSQQILDSCWKYAEILAEMDRGSEMYALYVVSINDLVDNYNHRLTVTFDYRIPSIVIAILFMITFLSMLVLGYQFGISGKGSFRLVLLLAISFGLVMFLILALDRPEVGVAKLNQAPVLKLQQQLNKMQLDR